MPFVFVETVTLTRGASKNKPLVQVMFNVFFLSQRISHVMAVKKNKRTCNVVSKKGHRPTVHVL